MRTVIIGEGRRARRCAPSRAARAERRAMGASIAGRARGEHGRKLLTEHVDGFVIEAAADSSREGARRRPQVRSSSFVTSSSAADQSTRARRAARPRSPSASGGPDWNDSDESRCPFRERAPVAGGEGSPGGRSGHPSPDTKRGDESIAGFVSRRLGPEAWANLVEPLITGIYGGDGAQPRCRPRSPPRALELEHGSVLRGLASTSASAGRFPLRHARIRNDVLVRTLCNRLESRIQTTVGRSAVGLRRARDGWVVELDDRGTVDADAVILAVPAFEAASFLAESTLISRSSTLRSRTRPRRS